MAAHTLKTPALPREPDEAPVADFQPPLVSAVAPFVPFPVEYLPAPVRDYVQAQARVQDCDEAAVALPVLSVLAAAIGPQRQLRLKAAWTEPAVLWTAVVAETGTRTRPGLEAAVLPLRTRQARACQTYQQQRHEFARQQRLFRRSRSDGALAEPEPLPPRIDQWLTGDSHLTSLLALLPQQQAGLLVCCEELQSWLGRPDAAGSRRTAEIGAWVDLHGARPLGRMRPTPVFLPQTSVSLTGTVDTVTLSDKLLQSRVPCSLTSRLLFAQPPSIPRAWTDDDVEPDVMDGYAAVIDRLRTLPTRTPERSDAVTIQTPAAASGPPVSPELVLLSPRAKQRFAEYVTALGQQQRDIDDVLQGWFTHLESHAARLALVLHQARWAAGEPVDPLLCDHVSMERAIALARWFQYEAQRVTAVFSVSPADQQQQHLIEWIHRRGGFASPRDLCRSNGRRYSTAEAAWQELDRLTQTGIGLWVRIPTGEPGGRTTEVLALGLSFVEPYFPDGVVPDSAVVTAPQDEPSDSDWRGPPETWTPDPGPRKKPDRTGSRRDEWDKPFHECDFSFTPVSR